MRHAMKAPARPLRRQGAPRARRAADASAPLIDNRPETAVQRALVAAIGGVQTQDGPCWAQAGERAPAEYSAGLPSALKSGIEGLSGLSMDAVKVHYNSPHARQLNAQAFARGREIHLAPGRTDALPHEAWHVVQQAQGRVAPTTRRGDGIAINDSAALEREADLMGAKALTPNARSPHSQALAPAAGDGKAAPGAVQRMISVADFNENFAPIIPHTSEELRIEVLGLLQAIEADQDMLAALKALADKLGPLANCLEGNPQAVAKAREAIEEMKGEIADVLEFLAANKQEELPPAQEIVDEKLRTNDFRVTSGLETYAQTFGRKFAEHVAALREGQHWFDGGAGLAIAMQEHLRSGGKGTAIAYSAKKPEPGPHASQKDVSDLDRALDDHKGRFSYVETGKYFGETDNSAFGPGNSGFDLVTDHNGVMMYTQDLSGDLGKYLGLLAVGGVMHLTLNPVDAVINDDPKNGVLRWLSDIEGVEVERGPGADAWQLTKTHAHVVVPTLKLLSYETVAHSNAPNRKYAR